MVGKNYCVSDNNHVIRKGFSYKSLILQKKVSFEMNKYEKFYSSDIHKILLIS